MCMERSRLILSKKLHADHCRRGSQEVVVKCSDLTIVEACTLKVVLHISFQSRTICKRRQVIEEDGLVGPALLQGLAQKISHSETAASLSQLRPADKTCRVAETTC